MLKALIIGADSVTPDIILDKKELFPTFLKMMETGTRAAYSAYVQKGYKGSYSSEQNWASLYTGLEPREHAINTNSSRGEVRRPQMKDFNDLNPFWKVLNNNGYSVGLWAADNCVVPVDIDGYVVSSKYQMISTPVEDRKAPRTLDLCKKAQKFSTNVLKGEPIYRIYPKTLKQQGYSFEELKKDEKLAEQAIAEYHFQEAIENFKQELEYWFTAMKKAQQENPMDVLFFYTPTTDLIAHCSMYCDNSPVLLEAYKLLDAYVGDLIKELKPEISVFVSDHGQQNFKELICCSDRKVQREAFADKDKVLWLKNGYIAFEAYNGALLFTAHALKGTFIISGKGIKRNFTLVEMRTLDFYPTILEMLECKVEDERKGYVLDIFDRPVINEKMLLKEEEVTYKSIALIQCHQPSTTDIILNELYIEKRFSKITVVGEEKYREIFQNNPRVSDFVAYEQYNAEAFEEVYCGMYNEATKEMKHMRIK